MKTTDTWNVRKWEGGECEGRVSLIPSTSAVALTPLHSTAVPFWGQTGQSPSSLSPKRDCGPKGGKDLCLVFARRRTHLKRSARNLALIEPIRLSQRAAALRRPSANACPRTDMYLVFVLYAASVHRVSSGCLAPHVF